MQDSLSGSIDTHIINYAIYCTGYRLLRALRYRNPQVFGKALGTPRASEQPGSKGRAMQEKELEFILNRDLLFDFYGDLLTDHQKRIFEEVVFNDCSVSEVARDEGISRQGISDLIRRTEDQLKSYEAKLGLVRKFRRQRQVAREIQQLAEQFETDGDMAHIGQIRSAAEQLLREA